MTDAHLLSHHSPTGIPVDRPRVIEDPDAFAWDRQCDMLVVGLGLAGASAALRASETGGLDILAIDRFRGGGASELSGGIVYAGGTHVQEALGIPDSTDNLYRYLGYETGELVSSSGLRRFAEASPAMLRWLERYGIVFGGPAAARKTSYPGKSDFLYYSGNETTLAAAARAVPAPRGHRAKPHFKSRSVFGGVFIMGALKQALARARGVTMLYQTAAHRLLVDANGGVIGAELRQIPAGTFAAWRHEKANALGKNIIFTILGLTTRFWRAVARIEAHHGRTITVRARRGVVLCAGGFIHNRAMVEALAPRYRNVMPLGTQGDDGSGIQLGASAGGATSQLDIVSAWRFINPPYAWMRGIAVTPAGERLTNEEQYGARLSHAMFERSRGEGWLIVDAAIQADARAEVRAGELLGFQKLPVQASLHFAPHADTIAALAAKIGIPASALEAEVARYNAAIACGEPDPLGKSDGARAPIATGPFYAIDISYRPKLSPIPGLTMGGLALDEETGAVLRADGNGTVAGLYAAGRNATGICSNFYVSGLSLADCIWSGWRAAEAIAARAAESSLPDALDGGALSERSASSPALS